MTNLMWQDEIMELKNDLLNSDDFLIYQNFSHLEEENQELSSMISKRTELEEQISLAERLGNKDKMEEYLLKHQELINDMMGLEEVAKYNKAYTNIKQLLHILEIGVLLKIA